MKSYLEVFIITLVCLIALIPLASNAPDGLKRVAEDLRIVQNEPDWKGLMPEYNFPLLGDSYASKIVSGTLGAFLVLGIAFLVGKTVIKTAKKDVDSKV